MCSSNMQQEKRLGWVSYRPIRLLCNTPEHYPRNFTSLTSPTVFDMPVLYCTPPDCTVNTMSSTCHTFSCGHVFQLLVEPANQKPGNLPGGLTADDVSASPAQSHALNYHIWQSVCNEYHVLCIFRNNCG